MSSLSFYAEQAKTLIGNHMSVLHYHEGKVHWYLPKGIILEVPPKVLFYGSKRMQSYAIEDKRDFWKVFGPDDVQGYELEMLAFGPLMSFAEAYLQGLYRASRKGEYTTEQAVEELADFLSAVRRVYGSDFGLVSLMFKTNPSIFLFLLKALAKLGKPIPYELKDQADRDKYANEVIESQHAFRRIAEAFLQESPSAPGFSFWGLSPAGVEEESTHKAFWLDERGRVLSRKTIHATSTRVLEGLNVPSAYYELHFLFAPWEEGHIYEQDTPGQLSASSWTYSINALLNPCLLLHFNRAPEAEHSLLEAEILLRTPKDERRLRDLLSKLPLELKESDGWFSLDIGGGIEALFYPDPRKHRSGDYKALYDYTLLSSPFKRHRRAILEDFSRAMAMGILYRLGAASLRPPAFRLHGYVFEEYPSFSAYLPRPAVPSKLLGDFSERVLREPPTPEKLGRLVLVAEALRSTREGPSEEFLKELLTEDLATVVAEFSDLVSLSNL